MPANDPEEPVKGFHLLKMSYSYDEISIDLMPATNPARRFQPSPGFVKIRTIHNGDPVNDTAAWGKGSIPPCHSFEATSSK